MSPADARAAEILSRIGANAKGAELGVWRGGLSSRLLVRKDVHLIMVDGWGKARDSYRQSGDLLADADAAVQARNKERAILATQFAEDRRTIIEADTVDAALGVEDGSLDFVFVDADHSYDGCRADIEAWLPKLKPGALLCGHDYDHPDYPGWGVKRAVDELASCLGLLVEIGVDRTWFVRLPGPVPEPSNAYERVAVCCVKWGQRYGPEYVNILADMVGRNLGVPHRFVCFTDDPAGLDEGIETRSLPFGLTGWWNKVSLFRDGLFEQKTRIVFLDLDVIVTGPLEELVDTKGIAHDWLQGGYNSSVMVWDAGEQTIIWDAFVLGCMEILHGDQDWIEKCSTWPYLPADWCPSYRLHSLEWPPVGAKIVCFHGSPKPHEVTEGWVPTMWRIGGLAEPRYSGTLNNDIAVIRENARINAARDVPEIEIAPPHDGVLVIAGGGPSLADNLADLPLAWLSGATIWALNGTHDWLIGKGIVPDGMVLLDSRADNVGFVGKPHPDVTYYLATQVAPEAFDALRGFDVRKWTAWFWGVEGNVIVGGGATVGLKAICLGYVLGYRRFRLFGYDSSYRDGENHAYRQPMNDGEAMTEVVAGGQTFTAARWMVKQVREFQELAKTLTREGCEIEVNGSGLLPTVAAIAWRAGEMKAAG